MTFLKRLPICKTWSYRRLRRRLKLHGSDDKLILLLLIVINKVLEWDNTLVTIRTTLPREFFSAQRHIQSLPDNYFTRMYRISKSQFELLSGVLRTKLRRTQRHYSNIARAVSVDVMLFVTLRLLAGASYLDVSWPYGIGFSTVYAVFEETLTELEHSLPEIRFPQSSEDCRRSADMFCTLRRSPLDGVIAALDGLAVEIQKPRLDDVPDPRKYFNRKGFFAVCVQAAVQANYRFCFVSARHSGATHDATAFVSTMLYDVLTSSKLPEWAAVVADDAYTNECRILTPYPGVGLTPKEDAFNAYLSSCRTVVEQAFGMLICRFGIFWSPIRYRLQKVTQIILVACKLHNFIIDNDDSSLFEVLPNHEDNNVSGTPYVHFQNLLHMEQENMRARNRSRESSTLRDGICDRLESLGFVRRRTQRLRR